MIANLCSTHLRINDWFRRMKRSGNYGQGSRKGLIPARPALRMVRAFRAAALFPLPNGLNITSDLIQVY